MRILKDYVSKAVGYCVTDLKKNICIPKSILLLNRS